MASAAAAMFWLEREICQIQQSYDKFPPQKGVDIPVGLLGTVAENHSIPILAETAVAAADLALSGSLVLEEVDAVLDVADGGVRLATTLDAGSSGAGGDGKGREDGSGLHFDCLFES